MKRTIRFSLRTFLILFSIIAIYFAYQANTARKQRLAVAVIEDAGGTVYYDWMREPIYGANGTVDYFKIIRDPDTMSAPKWLRQALGDDYFQRVLAIGRLYPHKINDEVISALKDLPALEEINLKKDPTTGPVVTDDELRKLNNKIKDTCGVHPSGPFS